MNDTEIFAYYVDPQQREEFIAAGVDPNTLKPFYTYLRDAIIAGRPGTWYRTADGKLIWKRD